LRCVLTAKQYTWQIVTLLTTKQVFTLVLFILWLSVHQTHHWHFVHYNKIWTPLWCGYPSFPLCGARIGYFISVAYRHDWLVINYWRYIFHKQRTRLLVHAVCVSVVWASVRGCVCVCVCECVCERERERVKL
jgi:hypothetical protein